jgi:hypothetical protein
MFRTAVYGLPPGLTAAAETYEAAFRWGATAQGIITGAIISSLCSDPGNSPTFEIRPGLLLGQRTADGTWTNYSPTATDGSEVAAGVNLTMIRMQDIDTGSNVQRFYGILVGGPVQAAKILGLDLHARQCMDKFIFDDQNNFPGNHWYPWKRFQTKTANYSIVAADNFSHFDNTGAMGEVDFTLPPIANGYYFAFSCMVAQVIKAISFEGGNLVGSTVTQTSVSATAIGGAFAIFSNPAGTKWLVEDISSSNQTLTFA